MASAAQGLFGIATILAVCWLLSEARAQCAPRVTAAALGLQVLIAALLLTTPAAREAFSLLTDLVAALHRSAEAGATLVFGFLGGGPTPP